MHDVRIACTHMLTGLAHRQGVCLVIKRGGELCVVPLHRTLDFGASQGGWLPSVTAAWQEGRVSNFDYLMYLNLAAGEQADQHTARLHVVGREELCSPSRVAHE